MLLAPRANPQREPELPRPPLPAEDPRAENVRQLTAGKEAFKTHEFGRAAERFRLAIQAAPKEPLAHFLLAQAQFALGKYHEALEAIQGGLRLNADWPTAVFAPKELYGLQAAEFLAHLEQLRAALERHPGDAVLLFLYAYQLWFDGRKDEARPLFQKAAALMPDKSAAELFLKARPGMPVVVR